MPDISIKTEPLRSRLRRETQQLHEQLHHLPLNRAIQSPDVGAGDYARFLQVHFSARLWLEQVAYKMLPDMITDRPLMTALIGHDLAVLGETRNISLAFNPVGVAAPEVAVAAAYVFWGSHLGNSQIAKGLRKTEAVPVTALRFLEDAEGHQAMAWRRLSPFLKSPDSKPLNGDAVVEAANTIFRAFGALVMAV